MYESSSKSKRFYFFVIGTLLIFLDQFIKYKIRTMGGFYICNHNIAFSLSVYPWLFWIIWLIMIGLVVIFLYKKAHNRYAFWLTLILAGAVANVLDRIFLGCVIDFIDLKFWPVFNLADIYITIGVSVIMVNMLRSNKL